MLDSCTQRSIGIMPEIPPYQKIDSVGYGNGDVCHIFTGLAWNRVKIDKGLRQMLLFRIAYGKTINYSVRILLRLK